MIHPPDRMSTIEKSDSDASPNGGEFRSAPAWQPGTEKYDIEQMDTHEAQRRGSIADGEIQHHRLGWMRLTICLIVEAIALGESLSICTVDQAKISC